MTKQQLKDKGYVLYGKQHRCRDHGDTLEKYYLPNGSGQGVIDYQFYCTKHKRTLFDFLEVIEVTPTKTDKTTEV